MSGWTEDEIFFDDEDMPIEEVAWNTMLWYGEAFIRFPLLQILRERLLHVDLSRKELLAELLVPPAYLVSGPMSTMPGQAPNFTRMMGLKAHSYAKFGQYGSHLGSAAWRAGAFTLRNAGFLGVVASLPWLYNNVYVPTLEGIIDYFYTRVRRFYFW